MSSWAKTYISGPNIDVSEAEREEIIRYITARPEIANSIPILRTKLDARDEWLEKEIEQGKAMIAELEADPRLAGVTEDLRRLNPATGRMKAIDKQESRIVEPLVQRLREVKRDLKATIDKQARLKEWAAAYRNKELEQAK